MRARASLQGCETTPPSLGDNEGSARRPRIELRASPDTWRCILHNSWYFLCTTVSAQCGAAKGWRRRPLGLRCCPGARRARSRSIIDQRGPCASHPKARDRDRQSKHVPEMQDGWNMPCPDGAPEDSSSWTTGRVGHTNGEPRTGRSCGELHLARG